MASQAATPEDYWSPEKWRPLLLATLDEKDGEALAASLGCREVVVNVTDNEVCACGLESSTVVRLDPNPKAEGCRQVDVTNKVGTVEPNSVLHVVATAGDSQRHLKCAEKIYATAPHLLTTAANSRGDTPLHCAARNGNTMMVEFLIGLAKGVNGVDHDKARDLVRMRNKCGETALHEAIRFDNVKMVGDLMGTDHEQLAQIDAQDGTSPLYLACSLDQLQIVKLILDKCEEPSYSGPRGQNALHAAVLESYRAAEITKLLLKRNKDLVKQTDVDGSTPLHFAASAQDPSYKFTLFVFSAFKFDFHFVFFSPWTYVKNLEKRKFPDPVIQLLEADPTAAFQADNKGSFPVHVAAASGCMVPLIFLLAKYPGCAGLQDADGRTFLHIAVQKKRVNAVKFSSAWCRQSFSNKSVVNVQDNKGDTALHLAVREGELDMSWYLIRNRHVHINLENKDGKTPMDLAAEEVKPGFYFGLSAPRRILNMLTFSEALAGSRRRDQIREYDPPLDVKTESEKIKEFAQIVGIGSVLVSTATFAAALTIPGGVWTPGDTQGGKKFVAALPQAGTPVLNGSYAFDGFVISNTLAFICATLATFSLVYCGVAAVDIQKRLKLVTLSLALLLCSARSFCAAFGFALYLLLGKVAHGTAIASIVMTSFALLDGLWFLHATYMDTLAALVHRKTRKVTWLDKLLFKLGGDAFLLKLKLLSKLGVAIPLNLLYLFWPYLVIGGYLVYDFLNMSGKFHGLTHH